MIHLFKAIAVRAKRKLESRKSLTETPLIQVPANVLVEIDNLYEIRGNHIIEMSLNFSQMQIRAHLAERRVEALAKLLKHYNVPADEIEEQLEGVK